LGEATLNTQIMPRQQLVQVLLGSKSVHTFSCAIKGQKASQEGATILSMSYLPYISDHDLTNAVKEVVKCISKVQAKADKAMYNNVIDPFSAIFDGVTLGISLEDWLKMEKIRQTQKTVQNAIGKFHQDILGSIPGWENLGKGVDIRNKSLNIIAEIKNKYNTVKGSDKVGIYDYLSHALNHPEYDGFTAYYVEIISKNKTSYNQPFTPSDRKTKTRRPVNESIRQVSGQKFYALTTGESEALSMLFDVLPDVISKVAGVNKLSEQQQAYFRTLFNRAY